MALVKFCSSLFGKKKPPFIIEMATNGNLNFTNVNKVTFEGVGAAPNAVIDTTTGKIGVGVDSPDANLHVVGNCHVSTNMELGGTLVMGTVTVEAQHALSAITATGNTTPHTIEFQNAETSLVTTGNVQVGKELTVTGDATFDTNTLKIDTNNNRVGIGTATPDYKLDVNGDIRGGCPVFFTAYAGNGSNATVTGSTGGTVIIFSNTTVNKGGAYDISNGRCTFPISGYYEIFFRGGTASTVDFHAKIYRNGDAPGTNGWPNHLPRLWDNSDRQFRNAGTIQFFYYFAVGEYIDVRLTNSSVFNADNYNSFSVKYLSN